MFCGCSNWPYCEYAQWTCGTCGNGLKVSDDEIRRLSRVLASYANESPGQVAHASGPNLSDDRRIGVSMHFMPPDTAQVIGGWGSAALVRGSDPFGHFEHTPVPERDFDETAAAFHARAAQADMEVLYAGAERNTQKV